LSPALSVDVDRLSSYASSCFLYLILLCILGFSDHPSSSAYSFTSSSIRIVVINDSDLGTELLKLGLLEPGLTVNVPLLSSYPREVTSHLDVITAGIHPLGRDP
jgi:hypothetical protein